LQGKDKIHFFNSVTLHFIS